MLPATRWSSRSECATGIRAVTVCARVKIGIVVPFSWSFWGAVVEHAELQAAALEELGHDVRLVMGNDPPGQFTRVLHPRVGRHGDPPRERDPGRALGDRPRERLAAEHRALSPRSIFRITRVLERERFDVLHLHEPMTPTICIAALVARAARSSRRTTRRGDLGWMRLVMPVWGFLSDRIDQRIAVSERARASASVAAGRVRGRPERRARSRTAPSPATASTRIVFAGRQEPRKGLQVLLRAWPEIHRRTGRGSRSRAPIRSPCGCC